MTDILIFFTADKRSAATRLHEGIVAAGYSADLHELPEENGLAEVDAQAGNAAAALLIWSRRLVSTTIFGEALGGIRRHANLIEVSTDGIAPTGSVTDEQRVVLISGWRGQPYHQGWRTILARLKSLAGTRSAAAPAPAPAPLRRTDKPKPGQSGVRSDAPSAPRRRTLGIALAGLAAAGLLALAALGLANRHERPPAAQPSEAAMAAPAQPAAAEEPAPQPAQPAAAQPADTEAPAPQPAPVPPAAAQGQNSPPSQAPAASAVTPAPPSPPAVPRRPARARKAAHASASAVRYSPRNSRVMRLFCARSGRNTPQCRVFHRAIQQ